MQYYNSTRLLPKNCLTLRHKHPTIRQIIHIAGGFVDFWPMAKKKDKLDAYAEHLFINEGWTQKAIAEYLEVTEKTIGDWKKAGKWEDKRRRILAAPHTIKTLLLGELEKVAKGEATNVDADSLSKIAKAIDTLDDKISIQVITSVFKEFDLWMVDQDPSLALKFTDYHRRFILHKINIDG